ncbi:MAG TPA: hypothetical protein PLH80_00130 [Spirochaetota bacterium]|nr:hypothetical protein [Spirochaetota bacterium]HOM86563.1 hypothetical protein [Spirochaetota bacterium]HOR92834.1 hypothetical protein [Spirochaetota bacterium]HOT18585.1 hypothetical protein [Spirochaetota bacterium]HPD03824.1 hypothetical protein [Spirochaetota bacterium]
MKKILLPLIITVFIHTNIYSYDLLKIGDNVTNYIKTNPVKYKLTNQKLSNWPEGVVTLLAYDTKVDGKSPIIVFALDKYPIGVLQGTSPNAYYIFDIDGDGILDTKTDKGIVPFWVVYANSKNKSKNDNITSIFNLVYESFQSDEGPYINQKFKESINKLYEFNKNINIENRDLAYLFLFYQLYNQYFPEQSLKCLDLLTKEYISRFNKIHPILLLYKAETLINLKQEQDAKKIIAELRKADPNFIPAKAYEYRLEVDKEKAKILLNNLKENHKNHWIVKQL